MLSCVSGPSLHLRVLRSASHHPCRRGADCGGSWGPIRDLRGGRASPSMWKGTDVDLQRGSSTQLAAPSAGTPQSFLVCSLFWAGGRGGGWLMGGLVWGARGCFQGCVSFGCVYPRGGALGCVPWRPAATVWMTSHTLTAPRWGSVNVSGDTEGESPPVR